MSTAAVNVSFQDPFLREICRVAAPRRRVRAIPGDPDDNMVLECALEARATMIVSGDSHLRALRRWRGIRILSPADFARDASRGV